MSYVFSRAIRRALRHKAMYSVIILELVIGLTVFAGGINLFVSTENRLDAIKQQVSESSYIVRAASTPGIRSNDFDAYLIAKTNMEQEGQVLYAAYGNFSVYSEVDGFIDCSVILLSSEYYAFAFPSNSSTGALIGEKLMGSASKKPLIVDVQFMPGNIVQVNGVAFKCDSMRSRSFDVLITGSGMIGADIPLDSSIILPLNQQTWDLFKNNNILTESVLRLVYEATTTPTKIALSNRKIIDTLNDVSNEYGSIYATENQLAVMKSRISDLSSDMQVYSWLAAFSLVVVLVGVCGMLIILLNRRRREYAIMLLIGVSNRMIAFELFIEVLTITLLSGSISCLLAVSLSRSLGTVFYTTNYQVTTIYMVVFVCIIITCLSCVVSLSSAQNKSPISILKSM